MHEYSQQQQQQNTQKREGGREREQKKSKNMVKSDDWNVLLWNVKLVMSYH